MADSRVRLLVSGRVQGVWYRASTRETGERLGLRGWVRNNPDGRVEAVVEGPHEDVASLLAWCRQGPPEARVDAVEVVDDDGRERLVGFVVRV